jgi:mitochondrial fission protein ELM1
MTKRDDLILIGLVILNIGAGIVCLFIADLPDHWLAVLPLLLLGPLFIATLSHLIKKQPDLIDEIEAWLRTQRHNKTN